MKKIDNLPDVLPQDLIEYFAASHDGANELSWENVYQFLTSKQRVQVLEYLQKRGKEEYEKIPEEERDAMYRASAVLWTREGGFITLWDEYNMSNDAKWYIRYAEEQAKRFIFIDFYGFFIRQFSKVYMTEEETFTLFSNESSVFSMCYLCQFTIDNMTFNSATQYIAYAKAELFRDRPLMKAILEIQDISQYHELSKQVKYFYRPVYGMMVGRFMRTVLEAKFTQNLALKEQLFATKGTTLALATVEDKKWSIGLELNDPLAQKRTSWQGQNILGELLTELRVRLMNEY